MKLTFNNKLYQKYEDSLGILSYLTRNNPDAQRTLGLNSKRTKRTQRNNVVAASDNTSFSKVNEKVLEDKNQLVKRYLPFVDNYRKSHPFATNWDYETITNFENSNTPISYNGHVYYPDSYVDPNQTYLSQGKDYSLEEHKKRLETTQQLLERERELKELEHASEIMNHPYNPIGWIPGLRTLFNVGADLRYSRLTEKNWTPYTAGAFTSAAADAVFGPMGPLKSYLGAYTGTVAGGLIGKLFENEEIGLLVGGLAGGITPSLWSWGRGKISPIYKNNSETSTSASYIDDPFGPPPEDYDAMLALFYPSQGNQYTNVNGYSVSTSNLDTYKLKYPEATNVEFGPISISRPGLPGNPTIISDVPSLDLLPSMDYFNNVVLPLAHKRGYNLELPTELPKYYRDIPYYETNGLGETRKMYNQSNFGGWYNPNDKKSYINYAADPSIRDRIIMHEYISHGTDSLISPSDMQHYNLLITFLSDNLPIRLSGTHLFKIPDSKSAIEMRATLNEVRKKAYEKGLIRWNLYGDLDVYSISDSDILNMLKTTNGYGHDYVEMYNRLTPDKRKQWMRSFRNAMRLLPVAGVGVTILNNAQD